MIKNTLNYFSYGASRSTEMIKAIIGRKPKGFDYELKGFELCLQTWSAIPKRVQLILKPSWGKDFKSYFIRRNHEKSVWGKVWIISTKEYKLIGNWELHNIWYKPIKMKKKIKGRIITIHTEIINDRKSKPVKDPKNYPSFPVSKKKIVSVAKKVRKEYPYVNKLK